MENQENIKKDIFGRPIELDQWVVFLKPRVRQLAYGKVVKLTPKNIRVEYKNKTWRSGYQEVLDTALCYPSDIAIVNEEVIFWYKLTAKDSK